MILSLFHSLWVPSKKVGFCAYIVLLFTYKHTYSTEIVRRIH